MAVVSASRLSVHGATAGSRVRQYVQQGHLARTYRCVAWSVDGSLVACGASDGVVVVWDVKRGVVKHALEASADVEHAGCSCVGFSHDGGEVYAGFVLGGGAAARHVGRWTLGASLPTFAAWDADKRGVTALAAHRAGKG